jgi:hypothetical protein
MERKKERDKVVGIERKKEMQENREIKKHTYKEGWKEKEREK